MTDITGPSSASNEPDALLNSSYRAPAPKKLEDIMTSDAGDESLKKYKEKLLGTNAGSVVIDAKNPKNVIVRSLTLIAEGRDEITMYLENVESLENQSFTIKEGCHYRLRINFHVQREIVAGLKYVQKVSRHSIPVDKEEYMVGSYGPKHEMQSFTTPVEEAPSGMIHRGTYKVKSLFTDDDQNEWLGWSWTLEIKKDW